MTGADRIIEELAALGFVEAWSVGEKKEGGVAKAVVRINTSKGPTYEKFSPDFASEIATWAKDRQP